MKRFIIGLMVLVWATAPASADPAPADIAGDWIGTLQTPGGKLSLVLTITEDKDGSLAAVLESPDQAPGQKIPVTSVSVTDGVLEFTSRAIGATYKGTWTGKAWQGDFNQGMALPLEFKRGELAPKPVLKGLDGEWTAEIVRNGQTIGFALTVETTERGTSATFAVPAMMAYGLPVADLSLDGDAFSFSVPAVASSFTGTFSGADAPIAGIWQRKGQEALETAFIRTSDKAAEVKRPQMPQEPFPYRSVDVSMPNAAAKGVTLSGTLTLPEGDGPFPAAILISGSGPQDRDETLLGHKPFAVLADYLTRQALPCCATMTAALAAPPEIMGPRPQRTSRLTPTRPSPSLRRARISKRAPSASSAIAKVALWPRSLPRQTMPLAILCSLQAPVCPRVSCL